MTSHAIGKLENLGSVLVQCTSNTLESIEKIHTAMNIIVFELTIPTEKSSKMSANILW